MAEQSSLFDAATLKGADSLRVLRDRALVCQKCVLHKTRTQVVYGAGNSERPPIMFVGEAPGANEDAKGVPFVGRAGELLDKMICALGYTRAQIYIANAACCRPPDNRKPEPDELAACKEHLVGQARVVQPRAIVALGASAAQSLLSSKKTIGELRGRWYMWEGIPVRATFHPAYLLRDARKKVDAWEDLQVVQQRLLAEATYK
jgi:uracil-DNA glycosylase family 4